jgi:NADPH:quinone reductase
MSQPVISFDALAIDHPGAPIRRQRKSVASPGDAELLIRVDHASINRMDPGLAQHNVFQLPEPYVLGFDFSGEVVQVGGAGGASFQVGDQVFGWSGTGGCFAERVVVKAEHVLQRGSLPAAEASTYGIAFLTAYESLVLTAEVHKHAGKWIFIPGAGGGVGHFAAQIARRHGLKVIGSGGKADSVRLLHDLRLEAVIDYSRQDVVAEVLRITGGKGADLVYDSTYNQSSYVQSAAVIAVGGEYTRLGTKVQLDRANASDMTSTVEARGAKMRIGDMYNATSQQLLEGQRRAIAWYEEGKVRPVITTTVPFDAAALQKAFDAFSRGVNNVGKIVVDCRTRTT